jgi:hypothetical protein
MIHIKAEIEEAVAFLEGGPCPACGLTPQGRVGELDLLKLRARPLVVPCDYCRSVPAGSPTEVA